MSDWVLACALDSLADGRAQRIELPGLALCVVRVGQALYAVEDRCPHRGARLSAGLVYDGCKLACSDHGWTIDVPTGAVEPPECGQVRTFRIEVRGAEVFIELTPSLQ